MNVPFVDLKAQYARIKTEIDEAIARVLNHTQFIMGEEVSQFEKKYSEAIGVKGTVGVASGTGALRLALLACGVGPGDEVITAAHTFFATAEAISEIGAKPVFADIEERTYTIDPNHVQDLLKTRGKKVKAILPVHLYGLAAGLEPLLELSQRFGAFLIEDAAQAHLAKYKGKNCGTFGHLACFSFFPGKNLGAYGDAGAVTGNDENLLSMVRKLRDHGRTSKYEHEMIGFGERLDALQAAVLSVKLKYLPEWTTQRRNAARTYSSLLESPDLILPYEPKEAEHAYHLYVIRARNREKLQKFLKSKDIQSGVHYPIPLHRQPAYLKQGYGEISLPVTEKVAGEILSLPMFPEITQEQIRYVASAVQEGRSL